MSPLSWNDARRILCIRLDSLGDVLMTTPAFRALKLGHRGRHLTLMTSPAGAEVARFIPEIDDVMVYEAPWMKATTATSDRRADLAMIDRLRAGNFDAVVIFTVYSQSPLPAALMCHLAGIPLRLAHCRENPYLLLTDAIPEPEPHKILRHEVRRQLDLVASIHCTTSNERLSLRPPSGARRRAQEKLEELGIYFDTRWVLVHPGASAPSRRYPADGFARAADQLARDHGLKVVFSGTASEGSLVETVQSCMTEDSHSVVGELSLAEYATLVHQAPVLISNNTGPVHIAAALGTPVVVLYAQTNPQHTPWDVPCRVLYHDVPCKFCYKSVCPEGHHDCLRRVPPERIVRAACELMTDRSGDEETVRSLPRSLTVLSSTSN